MTRSGEPSILCPAPTIANWVFPRRALAWSSVTVPAHFQSVCVLLNWYGLTRRLYPAQSPVAWVFAQFRLQMPCHPSQPTVRKIGVTHNKSPADGVVFLDGQRCFGRWSRPDI